MLLLEKIILTFQKTVIKSEKNSVRFWLLHEWYKKQKNQQHTCDNFRDQAHLYSDLNRKSNSIFVENAIFPPYKIGKK